MEQWFKALLWLAIVLLIAFWYVVRSPRTGEKRGNPVLDKVSTSQSATAKTEIFDSNGYLALNRESVKEIKKLLAEFAKNKKLASKFIQNNWGYVPKDKKKPEASGFLIVEVSKKRWMIHEPVKVHHDLEQLTVEDVNVALALLKDWD